MYTYPSFRHDPRPGGDGGLKRVRIWRCADWDCKYEAPLRNADFDAAWADA